MALGNRLLVFGSATFRLDSLSGILDTRRELCTRIPRPFPLSITLPEPPPPLTLAPVFPLDSVVAPNSERGRRLSSGVVDEPTDPLNPAHRTPPVLRPRKSVSLDQGSPKTLATMARPWTTGRLAAQGPDSGNGLKGKGPRSGRRTRTYPVAQQPSKRRARLSG